MASPQNQSPNAAPPRPGAFEELAKHHKETGFILIAIGVLWAVLPIYLVIKEAYLPKGTWSNALGPVFFWAVWCSLTTILIGVGAVLAAPGRKLGQVETIRLLFLILGGIIGILTAVLGLALPFTSVYAPIFTGGVEVWRKQPFRLYIVALALVGGLGLTFLSLQLSRGVERESALMRRLLYGFNAVFTTLLLCAVLLLVNLLPYIPKLSRYDFVTPIFAGTYDWTQSRLYSLSPRSRETLAHLDKPLKVYLFLNEGGELADQVDTLLENCRNVTPQISWENISSLDKTRIQELANQYKAKITEEQMEFTGPRLVLRQGILVVYGDPSKEQSAFLPRTSLVTEQPNQEGGGSEVFRGEGVFLKTIRSLSQGKQVVYFVQGDNELDINDNKEDSIEGVGLLVSSMKRNEIYEIKEWKYSKETPKIPDDADVVVAARPEKLKPDALQALYDYMGYGYNEANKSVTEIPKGRHGRLFVLSGVSLENNQMVRSGLEPLMSKLGVQIGDDRVLSLDAPGHPTALLVQTSRTSSNPVAKAFGPPNRQVFVFEGVRTVTPEPGGGGAASAEQLLVAAGNQVWVQTDLAEKPSTAATTMKNNPNARFGGEPICIGAAASEASHTPGMPNDPIHSQAGGESHPRLIVIGNADWISNESLLSSRDADMKYGLFTSCLSWLRGEPDIGAASTNLEEDKVRPVFRLSLQPNTLFNMEYLPLGHMILAVIAAGFGVWLVRRR